MKSIKIFAMAAAAAMIFASCSKEPKNNNEDVQGARLTIKLVGAVPQTRAIEEPGSIAEGTIGLNDGHIFVVDQEGDVIHSEALKLNEAYTGSGQLLSEGGTGETAKVVASDSRVYVVGNIPTLESGTVAGLTTFAGIQAAVSALSGQTDYSTPALANNDGELAFITVTSQAVGTTPAQAEVTVQLSPLFARIELSEVEAGGEVDSYKVAGIYVDEYYPSFNLVGEGKGTLWNQENNIDFGSNVGTADAATGPWVSDANVVIPGEGVVWAYHVGAGSVPRFVIHLTDIVVDGDPVGEDRYLTVTGYTGLTTEAFERGNIYRVGKIEFDETDLGVTPNPKDVNLTVMVDVIEWKEIYLTPSL